jgi:hypothetical protein
MTSDTRKHLGGGRTHRRRARKTGAALKWRSSRGGGEWHQRGQARTLGMTAPIGAARFSKSKSNLDAQSGSSICPCSSARYLPERGAFTPNGAGHRERRLAPRASQRLRPTLDAHPPTLGMAGIRAYGDTHGCDSPASTSTREAASNTSIFCSKSSATVLVSRGKYDLNGYGLHSAPESTACMGERWRGSARRCVAWPPRRERKGTPPSNKMAPRAWWNLGRLLRARPPRRRARTARPTSSARTRA